jgi:hypothetical protein
LERCLACEADGSIWRVEWLRSGERPWPRVVTGDRGFSQKITKLSKIRSLLCELCAALPVVDEFREVFVLVLVLERLV